MKINIMNHRRNAGFTLIELLVVVLIIGILASIAIPQYFKVVERARVSESHAFISSLKSAQERYLARQGNYILTNSDIDKLDITFSGAAPAFGMSTYNAAIAGGTCVADGSPGFNVALSRHVANPGVAPRYGAYTVLYDRCTNIISYPSCPNCTLDFGT